jgi:hypothetical protein
MKLKDECAQLRIDLEAKQDRRGGSVIITVSIAELRHLLDFTAEAVAALKDWDMNYDLDPRMQRELSHLLTLLDKETT